MYEFAPGSAGQSVQFLLRDSLTGQPKTGLTYASPGGVAGYTRQNGTAVSIPLATLATPTSVWMPGGFVEIDPILAKGVYRFDTPDAALAVGAGFATITLNFDSVIGEGVLILLRNPTNNVGPGSFQYTVTLQNVSAVPIAGGSMWVTTDAVGSNVIAGSLTSSSLGAATFMLSAGTYYLWVTAAGYTAVNPTAFTVTAAGGQTLTLAASTRPPSLTASTTHEPRTTAYDLVERLLDFVGSDADDKNYRAVRRAALDSLREVASVHRWTTLRTFGRLMLHGAYLGAGVGTVQYQGSSGTYPYQVTLTGDTFPSWASRAYIRIGNVVAKVDQLISPTVLTLKDPVFAADLDAGSAFTLYQDTYTLPSDFVFSNDSMAETSWGRLSYMTYEAWMGRVRYGTGVGTPHFWTIAGDPDVPGRLAISVYPAPDADATLDFMYYKRPRQITLFDLTTGTASVDGANANLITFSRPVLKASMKGSVVRLAEDQSGPPTDIDGLTPYAYEGTITSVVSTTQATVDAAAPQTLVDVSHRISDPIEMADLHQTLVARGAERNLSISRIMLKTSPLAQQAWMEALTLAQESDSRVSSRRAEGSGRSGRQRLANMPINLGDPLISGD
jgi:hypothetical protein